MNAPHPSTHPRRRLYFWALVPLILLLGHSTLLFFAIARATGPGGPIVVESTQQPQPASTTPQSE